MYCLFLNTKHHQHEEFYTYHYILIALFTVTNAQTDTEFWFAAPEVTFAHSGNSPILFRMASAGLAADVTID